MFSECLCLISRSGLGKLRRHAAFEAGGSVFVNGARFCGLVGGRRELIVALLSERVVALSHGSEHFLTQSANPAFFDLILQRARFGFANALF